MFHNKFFLEGSAKWHENLVKSSFILEIKFSDFFGHQGFAELSKNTIKSWKNRASRKSVSSSSTRLVVVYQDDYRRRHRVNK